MKTPYRRYLLPCIAALIAFTFASSTQAQNLVTNGSFESGFASWTLTSGTFSFAGSNAMFSHSGLGYANLEDTGAIASLSQSFATTVGQQYSISFWLASDSNVPPNSFAAAFGTAAATPQFSITNAPIFGYTQFTFNAVATTANSTIRFDFRNDDDFFRLDDVVVTAVPEPSTNVLMILSAAGLAGIVQYRRTKATRLSLEA